MDFPTTTTTTTKIDGKCDICTKPDGSRDHMNLQRCRECGVLVHELCYGLVPTSTKDINFVCHACAAVGKAVEVNEPSKVGGITMKDILMDREGVASFGEFIKCARRGVTVTSQSPSKRRFFQINSGALVIIENMIDFVSAADNFCNRYPSQSANEIYDSYLAKDAPKKVDLPSNILADIDRRVHLSSNLIAKIEAKMSNHNDYDNDDDDNLGQYMILDAFFDEAKRHVLASVEHHSKPFFAEYQKSPAFQTYLLKQRTSMKQLDRPAECVLCSVKTGIHAMHPLYDQFGKFGRQLVLPASGVGFMKKERRLAWVHTLCAMVRAIRELFYRHESSYLLPLLTLHCQTF